MSPSPRRRIAVCGSPELSVSVFRDIALHHDIALAITQPPRPRGRGHELHPTPVASWASESAIALLEPGRLSTDHAMELCDMGIEVVIVVAFGQILRPAFLDAAPPCWNLHFSALPAYRGASPVQHAILHSEKETGATIFQIQEGLDDGPILWQDFFSIEDLTTPETWEKGVEVGKRGFRTLLSSQPFPPPSTPQQGLPTFAPLLKKSDGLLIPTKHTAEQALRMIRAFTPWPGVTLESSDGTLVRLHEARLSDQTLPPGELLRTPSGEIFLGMSTGPALELLRIQLPGARPKSAREWQIR